MPDFWYIQPENRIVHRPVAWKGADGVKHPRTSFDLWTAAELREKGVYPGRYEPAPPTGRYEVSSERAPAIVGKEAVITRTYDSLPDPVPGAVTPVQIVRALREQGLKSTFDTAMSGASADIQEDWRLATVIRRDDSMLPTFQGALGLNDAQVDDLFRLAATK